MLRAATPFCALLAAAIVISGCPRTRPVPPTIEAERPQDHVEPEVRAAPIVEAAPMDTAADRATVVTQAAAEWRRLAPVPQARTEVSVTTDGRLIHLAGGFIAGEGDERSAAPRGMWVYDPQADSWREGGELPAGTHHAGFVSTGGRLYLVGGYQGNSFTETGAVRIYDPATGSWRQGAPMPTPRGALAVAVVNGRIHAIGGTVSRQHATHDHDNPSGEDRSVGTHEVYDPATDSWERRAPMPTARNHHGAAVVNGRIHVLAGRVGRNFEMRTHEIYDPATNSWTNGPQVPTGRSGVAVVSHGNHVYIFGGETFTEPSRTFDDAERFDTRAGRWETLPRMPSARHGLGAAVMGEHIYVVSGGPRPGFSFGTANERLTPRMRAP